MITASRSPIDIRTSVLLRSGHEERRSLLTRHDQERRQRILDCIARTVSERGYPPSVREIADAVGLASTSAVHHHLIGLERDGLLERGGKHSRALRVTGRSAVSRPAEPNKDTPF